MTLNDKCRAYRKNNKISVRDIAILSGCTEWAVYKFEEGKSLNTRILFAYIHLGFKLTAEDTWQVLTS